MPWYCGDLLVEVLWFLKCFGILHATIDSTATCLGDLFMFLSFSWDSIILWSTFSMKCFDTVFGLYHEILLLSCRCFLWSALILFLVFSWSVLFCGRHFLRLALILFWQFSWDSIVLRSTFSIKFFDTVFGNFHETLLFCRQCILSSTMILF